MLQEKEKILEVLKKGRELLADRPELKTMQPEKVLDELDSTNELIRNRWGAVAYLYADPLKNVGRQEMLEQLKQIKSGILTYEYVGFILQQEQDISLVDLLIDSGKSDCQDEIFPFVCPNLIYEKQIDTSKTVDFLDACRKCKDQDRVGIAIRNYADCLWKLGKDNEVVEDFLTDCDERYKPLIISIADKQYGADEKMADQLLARLMERKSTLCWEIVIIALQYGIRYSPVVLDTYFDDIEICVRNGTIRRIDVIPVYVRYVQSKYGYKEEEVVRKLNLIADGSIEEKTVFLEEIRLDREIEENLKRICEQITEKPIDRNARILEALDWMYYNYVCHGEKQYVLDQMKQIFLVNEYREVEGMEFFEGFGSVLSELKNDQILLLDFTLDLILHGTTGEFLFGILLWQQSIQISGLAGRLKDRKMKDEEVLILQKAILYYEVDTRRVCACMFELIQLLEQIENDIDFCISEIYMNYPATSYQYAKEHLQSQVPAEQKLSRRILACEEERGKKIERGRCIPDLYPSSERSEEYRKAGWEFQANMNKESRKKSLIRQLCSEKTMKYGKRHAYIQRGRKGELSYQVSNYTQMSLQMELPNEYMKDSFLLNEKRRQLEEERREKNASDYQGLSGKTEGEG